jgi:hypothetical protein
MKASKSEGGSGWEAVERTAYAVLAAPVAVAAPLLFYRFTLPHGPDDIWLTPWALAPVFGTMVFELISRPRPKLRYGLAFAALLALVFGVWAGIQVPFKEGGGWPVGQRVGVGVYFFFLTLVGGALGAGIASFLTSLVEPRRAWLVGLLIVGLDLVVAAVLTGLLI